MSKGPWRSAIERALGRSDNVEHGVGRGNYSTNHGGHTYNALGITDHQQYILEIAQQYGITRAADFLGVNKRLVQNTVDRAAEIWDVDNTLEDVSTAYNERAAELGLDTPTGWWDNDGNYHPTEAGDTGY